MTEAEKRATEVRARRGPRVPKDPELEREQIETRVVDEWIDEGSVRREAEAAADRAGAATAKRRRAPREIEPDTASRIASTVGPQRGARLSERLAMAMEAMERDRLSEAQRIVRPLVDELPDVGAVRRVAGLTAYRLGQWKRAVAELETAQELDPTIEHLPVLADAHRALRRWARVDEIWADIRAASPAHEVMAEGRMVAAGAAADRGRLKEALAIMEPAIRKPKRVRAHHLRQWYVLGDLHDRAGDPIAATRFFEMIVRHQPGFADVQARLDALGR